MVFNSIVFLFFAALFYSLWPLMRRGQLSRWIYISIASLVFYGWWDWHFTFLLLGTALVDFGAALAIARFTTRRRFFLIASITANLGVLFCFKYSHFFARSLDILFHTVGIPTRFVSHIPDFFSILPIGISFYTFQSMSYTIDVYRGELKPTKNFLHFFASISLFPHLVAGPILRAADMLPQLMNVRPLTENDRWDGLVLVVQGFFKKCVLADNFAPVVAAAFAPGSSLGSGDWWFVMLLFSFQIYYDFSGYTDIARGLARWMGYDFVLNFNLPYTSRSLREFWMRWHISLSTWFRDYVYIPLGGSHLGEIRGYINLWITLLLSALWHGAAMTFLTWGAWHACWLSIERGTNWPHRLERAPGGKALACLATFLIVMGGWVFFRSPSLFDALRIGTQLLRYPKMENLPPILPLTLLFLSIAWEALASANMRHPAMISRSWRQPLETVGIACAAAAAIFFRGPGTVFIYFQF